MSKITAGLALLPALLITASCSTLSAYESQSLRSAVPQYAVIQAGKLEYYQIGQGSAILLVPGFATDITSWDRRFVAKLAAKHQLIIFNHRNVAGSSIRSKQGYTADLAKDMQQLLQQLHLKKPAVLGISMGGMVAQQFAASYPESVSKLILINTAIAGQQSVHPSPTVEKRMLNMPSSKLGRYALALQLFFPASERLPMALALIFQRFLPKQYSEIDAAAVMPQQRALLLDWLSDNKTAKKLAHFKHPVLILNGESDAVIPAVNSVILAKTLPNARLERWPEGGHAMIYQYPEELAKRINAFIRNN